MPSAAKLGGGPFLYVWLSISMLLNVSGMASIVDGFVVWVGFFREIIDQYRIWVREPILWVVNLTWPSGWPPIPGWVADYLCICSSVYLAMNVVSVRQHGKTTLVHYLDEMVKQEVDRYTRLDRLKHGDSEAANKLATSRLRVRVYAFAPVVFLAQFLGLPLFIFYSIGDMLFSLIEYLRDQREGLEDDAGDLLADRFTDPVNQMTLYWLLLMGSFIFLMFINWQFMHAKV